MYDGLRVLVLGACNLNDTVYSLEKNTDHWPRIRMAMRDVWNPNTLVVHSLQDTLFTAVHLLVGFGHAAQRKFLNHRVHASQRTEF
jgi:hypothetical protein